MSLNHLVFAKQNLMCKGQTRGQECATSGLERLSPSPPEFHQFTAPEWNVFLKENWRRHNRIREQEKNSLLPQCSDQISEESSSQFIRQYLLIIRKEKFVSWTIKTPIPVSPLDYTSSKSTIFLVIWSWTVVLSVYMCLINIPIWGNQKCLNRGRTHAHACARMHTHTPQSKEINYAEDWQDAPKTQREFDMNSRMRKENE